MDDDQIAVFKKIGRRTRHYRKNILGLTQEEFADRLSVNRSSVGYIETAYYTKASSYLDFAAIVRDVYDYDILENGDSLRQDPEYSKDELSAIIRFQAEIIKQISELASDETLTPKERLAKLELICNMVKSR